MITSLLLKTTSVCKKATSVELIIIKNENQVIDNTKKASSLTRFFCVNFLWLYVILILLYSFRQSYFDRLLFLLE